MSELFKFELQKKLKFNEIYQREALYRSALALYTKSLFSRKKARTVSWDGGTLYDFASNGTKELDLLHKKFLFVIRHNDYLFHSCYGCIVSQRGF